MNRIYQLVWSQPGRAPVPVPETARRAGKRSRQVGCAPAIGLLMAGLHTLAWADPAPNALPTGAQVVAGQATVRATNGPVLNIDQASDRAVINWGSFNVGSAATVNFNQPNAGSATLNRVQGGEPSQIFGKINATGQVFLLNPNGVLFGSSARVDVGGIVATTHKLSDDDFMAGRAFFERAGATGAVVNQGNIHAAIAGYAALLAPEVRNEGVIVARMGTVALASGEAIALQFEGSSVVGLTVTPSTIASLVSNQRAVQAPGGLIVIAARSAPGLASGVIQNSGTIEATGAALRSGRIVLEASDQVLVTGASVIDAGNGTGTGGSITVTAPQIALADSAQLRATGAAGGGQIHIGGEWQGGGITPQATAVYVGQDTVLDASATARGDGGEVVVWSNVLDANSATRVFGSLRARGGELGGHGGRIETSGHWLDVAGIRADAGAALGIGGMWLLDPYSLTVNGSATTATTAVGPPYTFSAGAGGTTVLNTDINAQLSSGTSVTLRTTGSAGDGNGVGDITIASSIAKTGNADATLTLQAHESVIFNTSRSISASGAGKLNVTLNADSDGNGSGGVIMNIGSSITSNGGNISLGGGVAGNGSGNATSNATYGTGVYLYAATLTAGGGNVTLRGAAAAGTGSRAGVSINGSSAISTTGAGAITISGTGAAGDAGLNKGIYVGSSTISGGSTGGVVLTGTAGNPVTGGSTNYGIQVIGSTSAISSSGGHISLTGTGGGGSTSGTDNIGVSIEGGQVTAGGAGTISLTGTGGSSTGVNSVGVNVQSSSVISSGGNVSITGTGGAGGANHGVAVLASGLVRAGGSGAVQIDGTSGTGSGSYGVYAAAGGEISSLGGNVTLAGVGSAGASSIYGVVVGGTVKPGGSGALSVTGTGGSTGNTDHGVNVSGSGLLGSSGGNVTVVGTGGGASGTNHGVVVTTGGTISSGAGGTVSVTGTAGAGSAGYGISMGGTGTISTVGNEALTLTTDSLVLTATDNISAGTGSVTIRNRTAGTLINLGGADVLSGSPLTLGLTDAELDRITAGTLFIGRTGASASGNTTVSASLTPALATHLVVQAGGDISLAAGQTLTTLTNGSVTLNADSDGSGTGAIVLNSGSGITSNGGNITLGGGTAGDGSGSALGSAALIDGIYLNTATLTAGGGNVALRGQGYLTVGVASRVGVRLSSGAVSTTGAGTITVAGTAGIGMNVTANNTGVQLSSSTLTGGSTGTVTVTGSAGGTASGDNYNYGVNLSGTTASITSTGGNVSVTGVAAGGGGGTVDHSGVRLELGSSIQAGGSGTVQVTGTGSGASTVSGGGVSLQDTNSRITSAGGNVSVTGQGASGIGHGINLSGTSSISAGGAGQVQVSGTGGSSGGNGVVGAAGTSITSSGGNVIVSGTSGAANSGISVGGTLGSGAGGTLSVTGAAGGSNATYYGVNVLATGRIATPNNEALTITTDSLNMTAGATMSAGTGIATLRNRTAGTLINLGGSDGQSGSPLTLGLTDSELDRVTAGTLVIGRNDGTAAGNLTVSAGTSPAAAGKLVLQTGGDIAINAVVNVSDTLTLTAGSGRTVSEGASGGITAPRLLVNGSGALTALDTAGGNSITTLAASGVGNFSVRNNGALAIDSVGAVDGIGSTGTVSVSTASGNLTLSKDVTTTDTSASAVSLNAGVSTAAGTSTGGNMILNGGAVTVGSGGRATLMTGSVSGSTGLTSLLGSGSGRFRYDSDETNTHYSAALGSGLYAIYREQPTLTATVTNDSRAYNGLAYSGGNGVSYSGLVNGDNSSHVTASPVYGGTAQGAVNAGSYTLSASGLSSGLGYAFSYVAGSLTIQKADLTLSGTRVYDGSTVFAGSQLTATGVHGETFVVSGAGASGNLASRNVQGGQALANLGGLSLGSSGNGGLASNYNGLSTTGSSVSVTTAPLTLTTGNVSKVYDGNTSAAGSVLVASGSLVGGDSLSGGSFAFATRDAGSSKSVNTSGVTVNDGNGGANYSVAYQVNTTSTITPKDLSISGIVADSKVYDGSAVASLSGGALSGVVSGDAITLSAGSASFADRNVGSAKLVTASGFAVTGTDAGNYTLAQPAGLVADITPRSLSLGGITADNKVYDGSTLATLTGGSLSGVVIGDAITVNAGSASFADKGVGSAKVVTASGFAVSGTDAGNYTLAQPAGLVADVTPRALTVNGVAVDSKVYDGSTLATLQGGSLGGLVNGDTVVLGGGSASFADRNVGTGKAVTAVGFGITGNDAGNYTLAQPTGLNADITAATLTLSTGNVSKVYDGNTLAAGSTVIVGGALAGGDTLSGGSFAFTSKDAGSSKTVLTSGVTVNDGNGGANYGVVYQANTGSTITPKALTVDGLTANDKVYDGTALATLNGGTLAGVVSGDAVALNTGSASFADRNAGSGKAVTVSGLGIGGADAGNYSLVQPAALTASIGQASLTLTSGDVSKVYDGNTVAAGSLLVANGALVGGDTLAGGSFAFTSKDAGNSKSVLISGVTVNDGHGGANYNVSYQANTTSTITPKALVVNGLTANDKVYDGSALASLNGGALGGVVSGDAVVLNAGSASFADRNAGTAKAVTATGFGIAGADAGNYSFTQPVGLSADITAASITLTSSSVSKIYDGSTAAAGGLVIASGAMVGGDTLGGGSFAFASKDAGSNKSVLTSGVTVNDGHGGANYNVVYLANTTSTITPKVLSLSGVAAADKVYDGSALATLSSGTLGGVVSGDAVVLNAGTASFADKNAGTAKAVTATGFGLDGGDAGNYTLAQPTGLTADITLRTLTVGFTGVDKPYDGTRAATVRASDDRVAGDALTIVQTASFADAEVGRAKPVAVGSVVLSGTDAGNYTLVAAASANASIVKLPEPEAVLLAQRGTASVGASSPLPAAAVSVVGINRGQWLTACVTDAKGGGLSPGELMDRVPTAAGPTARLKINAWGWESHAPTLWLAAEPAARCF